MKLNWKMDIEIFICIAIAITFSFLFALKNNKSLESAKLISPIVIENTSYAATKAVINPLLKTNTIFQTTPDGTEKLIMTETQSKNGTKSYVFKTAGNNGENEHLLYTTTTPTTEGLSLPFNAWSPDNKYVFIQNNNGDTLVFKATGEDIIENTQYFDVGDLFNTGNRKDTYKETTGWASPTLLIINTTAPDGTKGSSYWFEVPSKAIIQLSTQF